MTNEADIITYKVRMGDSLQRIALNVTGNAEDWINIASYNSLDPPFIVNYKDTLGAQKAEGIANLFTDVAPVSNIIITKDTKVATPLLKAFGSTNDLYYQYEFVTTEQIILAPTFFNVPVKVQAVKGGAEYNLAPRKLSAVNDTTLTALGVRVANNGAFSGGSSKKVVSPGDILFIPIGMQADTLTFKAKIPIGSTLKDWGERVLGQDFVFIREATKIQRLGQIANDIKTTSDGQAATRAGVQNLAQSITHRLTTQKGELLYHPEYGSLLPGMIGTSNSPETKKLMSLEARDNLLSDPRVVTVLSLDVTEDLFGAYYIDAQIEVLGSSTPVALNLVMPVAT